MCSDGDRSPQCPSFSSAWRRATARPRSLRLSKALQHPTSGKWVVEMQFVTPAHHGKIAVGHWTRQIIDSATAEAEKFRLAHNGQIMLAVDHFFRPASPLRRTLRIENRFPASAPRFWHDNHGTAQHRHSRHHTRFETEKGRVNSTIYPRETRKIAVWAYSLA